MKRVFLIAGLALELGSCAALDTLRRATHRGSVGSVAYPDRPPDSTACFEGRDHRRRPLTVYSIRRGETLLLEFYRPRQLAYMNVLWTELEQTIDKPTLIECYGRLGAEWLNPLNCKPYHIAVYRYFLGSRKADPPSAHWSPIECPDRVGMESLP